VAGNRAAEIGDALGAAVPVAGFQGAAGFVEPLPK
jgi:hypothetical protein